MVALIPEAPSDIFIQKLDNPKKYLLDARYRCDSCGAQAYIQAVLKSDLELFFCRHHGNKHFKSMKSVLKEWYTEEIRLTEHNKLIGSEN